MWAEYQKLETKYKNQQFFKSRSAFMNILNAHLESSLHIRILVNAPIIETVVGDLLFHPDDVDGMTCERALSLCKKLEEPSGSDEVGQHDMYEFLMKMRCWFRFCIKFVSYGASFRMLSRLVDCTQVESSMVVYVGCSDVVVSSYTRIVCADALHILSDVLREVWYFSIAVYGLTHQGMSYLYVRVRFHWKWELLNFYLMAIPM